MYSNIQLQHMYILLHLVSFYMYLSKNANFQYSTLWSKYLKCKEEEGQSQTVANSWAKWKAERMPSFQMPGCRRQFRDVISNEWGWWESEKDTGDFLGSHGSQVTKKAGKGGGGKCRRSFVVGLEENGVSLQMEQGPSGSGGRALWLCGAVMRHLGVGVRSPEFQSQLCHCITQRG